MSDFINYHLNVLRSKKFISPDIELRSILKYSKITKKDIFLSNFNINLIDLKIFSKIFKRRILNEPISKIINNKEFYSLDFFVDKNVLDPRPESEFIIETAKKIFKSKKQRLKICDLGTGSGCLAITLAKIYNNSSVVASDISLKALKVAKINSKKHKVDKSIKFINCNWFDKKATFDLIVCNPPYLSSKDYIKCQIEWDCQQRKIIIFLCQMLTIHGKRRWMSSTNQL